MTERYFCRRFGSAQLIKFKSAYDNVEAAAISQEEIKRKHEEAIPWHGEGSAIHKGNKKYMPLVFLGLCAGY